jgi:hypothetical protein
MAATSSAMSTMASRSAMASRTAFASAWTAPANVIQVSDLPRLDHGARGGHECDRVGRADPRGDHDGRSGTLALARTLARALARAGSPVLEVPSFVRAACALP